MALPALRSVPQPREFVHVVLRSGSEDIVGAHVIANFPTEREATEEAQRLLAKSPEFHFWHLVVAHEMERTTVITSRSTGASP